MAKILKFLVTLAILFIGMKFFPNNVQIDGYPTLILATAIIFFMDWLYGWILGLSFLTSFILIGCVPLIISVICLPFIKLIELWIVDACMEGFNIHGFWTYVILFVSMSIFTCILNFPDGSDNNNIQQIR